MFMNGKELKMEIKQLEYFAAAVEYGSLNRQRNYIQHSRM